MEVNIPNLVADLILTGIVLWLTNQWREQLGGIIASRDQKISELEQRNEDLQMEFITTLRKLKIPGESDTQSKRPSKLVNPALSDEERAAAVRRMNEE